MIFDLATRNMSHDVLTNHLFEALVRSKFSSIQWLNGEIGSIEYLCLKRLQSKQIFEDMVNKLSDQCPSYATEQLDFPFKRGKLSVEDD